MARAAVPIVLAIAALSLPRGVWASDDDAERTGPLSPSEVRGVDREAREPDHAYRTFAQTALFLPRKVAELVLFTTGEVAGIIEDEQFVPRAREVFDARDGAIAIFPTFFLETGTSKDVGARMIANLGNFASSLRVGYGGAHTNVAEARMRFGVSAPLIATLSLEGLHDERKGLAFLGMGQHPFEDPRNRYLGEPRPGIFRERRERIIGSLGVRPTANTELFFSTGLVQRRTEDASAGEEALSHVFDEASLPGAFRTTRVAYSEVALRYDSRSSRKALAEGLLFEGYTGFSQEVAPEDSQFLRAGIRAAGFFPIVRATNILSPRVVLDGLTHLAGAPVPFRELVSQPSFRGADNRRDDVSLVLSLDYRWPISRYIGARLFVDGATVAPSLAELDPLDLRPAWGFGIDLHSSDAALGQVAIAMSPEGASFLLTFGAHPGFGDRQHRD